MSDLEQLKLLLFGNEKRALDALTRRLDKRESRAADVADVLPVAVRRSDQQSDDLRQALRKPVETTLSDAIRRDPESFADALFPVMGPAIRKAIAEAMKSVLLSIQHAMDTSLSPSARLQAWRAGVPLAEWVLRDSLIYRVDEVYLIDPDNGLLMQHVSHKDVRDKDEDAVSAMLTAIQDFVRDSFSGDQGHLDSAAIGEFTVWIEHGPQAMLACVIRGAPPAELRATMTETLEEIHLLPGGVLAEIPHKDNSFVGQKLNECLQLERSDATRESKQGLPKAPLIVLGLIAIGLLAWAGYRFWLDGQLARVRDVLVEAPGIVVTDARIVGGKLRLEGLRDPLAAQPAALASAVGVSGERLDLKLSPYQSLETEMVRARAVALLQPPATVTVAVRDGVLQVAGTADADWQARLVASAPLLPGIAGVDASGLQRDDEALRRRIRERLAAPETVSIELAGDDVRFSGRAPLAWLQSAPALYRQHIEIGSADFTAVMSAENSRLTALGRTLDGQSVHFAQGAEITSESRAALPVLRAGLIEYANLASTLGRPVILTLRGYTDGTGTATANRRLQLRRADRVREALGLAGVSNLEVRIAGAGPATRQIDNPEQRKVVLSLSAE